MNNFAEKHLKFFDAVVLFADFWEKNSQLKMDFVLTSSEEASKVVFTFLEDNDEQLALFQQHVLRHFFRTKLVSAISYFHPNIIELKMIEENKID